MFAEAVYGTDNYPVFIGQWGNIHDNDNPRAIGPLDVYLGVINTRGPAGKNVSHRALIVGQEFAICAKQHVGPAESLVGVSTGRLAAPESRGLGVVIRDHAR